MDIALFSPSSLFADDSGGANSSDEEAKDSGDEYVERNHQFPGMELLIREFSFHELNANLLWPGTFSFAEWLVQHRSSIEGRRIIELGSGTGALAIFLKKSLQLDITTSDYDDHEIEENIAHNCKINGVIPDLPHIKHKWGDAFPIPSPDWDLILASDILLYVKQYPNLIKTLSFLFTSYKPKDATQVSPSENENADGNLLSGFCTHDLQNTGDNADLIKSLLCTAIPFPAFLMSWRRRIGKEEESLFFKGCEDNGLEVQHLGSRIYCIHLLQKSC